MKHLPHILLACLMSAFIFSCTNEFGDSSPVLADTDFKTNQIAYSGEIVRYNVLFLANEGELRDYRIFTYDKLRGNVELEAGTLSGIQQKMEFMYNVPELEDDTVKATFNIHVTNTKGSKFDKMSRTFTIVAKDQPLDSYEGVTLYNPSDPNDPADAYYLHEARTIVREVDGQAHPEWVDIYVVHADSLAAGVTNELRTGTDVQFAKAPSFNFATATTRSLKHAYELVTGVSGRVRNLEDGDIILIGHGNKACGVIKVVKVYSSGKLELSIKLVKDANPTYKPETDSKKEEE